MKVIDLLDKNRIIADLQARDKRGAVEELAATLVTQDKTLSQAKVVEVLLERERLGSTGIGDNIAIPHGKLKNLSQLIISFGRSREGVNFDSMDGKPTHLFFLLIAPENSVGVHLRALAKISRMLKNPSFRQKLMDAPGPEEIYQLIAEEDALLG
ncbi:MAG: PTS sugar transporter subunit IIA [Deltaproteobacteria bacterium]|nr:PTS sugar transporter subunit IIA [Deltaproteobacteria bacterium]MBW1953119.1 PTS sugar transporter subunit IIA [Deltaproteobacteria bacterium]MBW1986401.1 PTS sugar transporter subunit IIA [Deltaproteobacteria bacterium]MBW2133796.1 PTS sugar transporter subunit IIA [Deltaproteobacteria bacterium]